jgi:hypothetical protein
MLHSHDFKNWTFADAVDRVTFTTVPVLNEAPILDVYHHLNGDWQFLCGTTVEEENIKLVCLGCMVERDPTLLQLGDLPRSWRAFRKSSSSSWVREEFDDTDGGEV